VASSSPTQRRKNPGGKVIAEGPGKRDDKGNRIPLNVREGDRILFGRYAGTEVIDRRRRSPDHAGRRYSGRH
jgi:co-chaperonin GroES (HSP10)